MLASGKLRFVAAAAHGRRRKQLQHPCWAPIKCTVVTASFTSFVLLSPAFPRQTPPHASTSQTSLVASCPELTSPALSCALTLVTPEHRIEACKRYSEYHSLRRFWQDWEEDDEEEEDEEEPTVGAGAGVSLPPAIWPSSNTRVCAPSCHPYLSS